MITEIEFNAIIQNPLIQQVAARARPFATHEIRLPPVASRAVNNRSEMALANWIAVLTKVFLKARGAASNPLIERVWKFADGNVDIDIRVGIHGGYHKFKVVADMTGPTSFRLKIYSWNPRGEKICDFERFGALRGNVDRQGIETLPVS
jgi:hypothetical protein